MTPRSRTLLGSAALALALGTIGAQAQTPAAPATKMPAAPATSTPAPGATTAPPAAAKPSTTPADKMATTGTSKPMAKSAKPMHAKSMPMKGKMGTQAASAQDPQVDALNNQSLMSAQKGTNFTPSATTPAAPAPMMKGKAMPMKKNTSS